MNTLRYYAGSFLIIVIVGCASPGTMRESAPSLRFTSTKSAQVVSMCIANRWENLGLFGASIPVNMRPIEHGFTISWRNPTLGQTALMVDVTDTEKGSESKYYKNIILAEGRFDAVVAECQR